MLSLTKLLPRSRENPRATRFIARQPIFDRAERVFGYELLFRSGSENCFTGKDGDEAARDVVDNLLSTGTSKLTSGRKAFINCTRQFLVNEYPTLLPMRDTVVEILETVEPDEPVLSACRNLKRLGYVMALDDFVYADKFEPFVELADIIKVDFKLSPPLIRERMARKFLPVGIQMLAEKVETREDFHQARNMGYCYFQGYFFCKPQIVSSQYVPAFKLHYLRVLQAISKPELELTEIENIVQREVSLCHKLLKYVNSAIFGFRREISSVRHALALLGDKEVKKWVAVTAVLGIAGDKPSELVVTSLARARCCELLSSRMQSPSRGPGMFLMGMFSLMDAMLGRPMADIVAEVALPEEVRAALLGGANRYREVFDLVAAYEAGKWSEVSKHAARLKLDQPQMSSTYLESVEWAQTVFQV